MHMKARHHSLWSKSKALHLKYGGRGRPLSHLLKAPSSRHRSAAASAIPAVFCPEAPNSPSMSLYFRPRRGYYLHTRSPIEDSQQPFHCPELDCQKPHASPPLGSANIRGPPQALHPYPKSCTYTPQTNKELEKGRVV